MLDNNNQEVLNGTTEYIESKIKSYLKQGYKVTILEDKNITLTRSIVKIKIEEKPCLQSLY
jgi:hypothetical protein